MRITEIFQVTVYRDEDGKYILVHNGTSYTYENSNEVAAAISQFAQARFEW